MAVIHPPESIMKDVGLSFDIKNKKYGPPTSYLVANIEPLQISFSKYAWNIKCNPYVAVDVQKI